MSQSENLDFLFKVVIIGDAGVGKTNILQRFINNKFSDDYQCTLAVDFLSKSMPIKGQNVRIQFWDTAGQERFAAIAQTYYQGAQGAIVVYDITNRRSFDRLKNWIQNIKNVTGENCQILIIGNKTDLNHKRAIEFSEAQKFTQGLNIAFCETSAMDSKNKEINNSIIKLINEIFEFQNHSQI